MRRKKFIRKVEKFATEEVSKELRQYCGEDFSLGPILVNPDYQAYRERSWDDPKDILITVVYQGDLSEAPPNWEFPVFNRVWRRMNEEWIENFYPHFDYIPKSKWEGGERQERKGWGW